MPAYAEYPLAGVCETICFCVCVLVYIYYLCVNHKGAGNSALFTKFTAVTHDVCSVNIRYPFVYPFIQTLGRARGARGLRPLLTCIKAPTFYSNSERCWDGRRADSGFAMPHVHICFDVYMLLSMPGGTFAEQPSPRYEAL